VGLSVAGPQLAALLQTLVRDDLSTGGVPILSFLSMDIGMVRRVSPVVHRRARYEIVTTTTTHALRSAGGARTCARLQHFGRSRTEHVAIEKSSPWAREYRPIYGPHEAGLDRFVDFKKGDFIGRGAALEEKQSGGTLHLTASPWMRRTRMRSAMSPLARWQRWSAGLLRLPSAKRAAVASALVKSRSTGERGFRLQIEIIGQRPQAVRRAAPAVDAAGARMRIDRPFHHFSEIRWQRRRRQTGDPLIRPDPGSRRSYVFELERRGFLQAGASCQP